MPTQNPASSLLLSMGAAIVVTGVVFGSAELAHHGDNPAQQAAPGYPQGRASSVPAPALGPASASDQPGAPPSTLTRPTVEIRWTRGQSWVRVIDSQGNVVLNDIYNQGTVKEFTGPSFLVEMGNAGAITLIERGGPPVTAGGMGEPARFSVAGP